MVDDLIKKLLVDIIDVCEKYWYAQESESDLTPTGWYYGIKYGDMNDSQWHNITKEQFNILDPIINKGSDND